MRALKVMLLAGMGMFLVAGNNADGAGRFFRRTVAVNQNLNRNQNQNQNQKSHTVHGVVVKVHHGQKNKNNKSNHTGSVVIKIHHKNTGQNNGKTNNVDRAFQIGPMTQITHNGKTAGLSALRAGEHVVVQTASGHPHLAAHINIVTRKKKT